MSITAYACSSDHGIFKIIHVGSATHACNKLIVIMTNHMTHYCAGHVYPLHLCLTNRTYDINYECISDDDDCVKASYNVGLHLLEAERGV